MRIISALAPRKVEWLRRRWGDSYQRWRIDNAMRSAGFCGKVMAGPFSGLNYSGVGAFGSVLLPKLLGTYELELREVIDEIVKRQPPLVIDIGAAEGYYAVGIAMSLRDDAEIVAFETNQDAHRELALLAEMNGVAQKITCRGECTLKLLGGVLQPDCLIICDCEGGEVALLDSRALPGLRDAAILVELHDGVVPNIADEFVRRFAPSHSIAQFDAQPRKQSDCSILSGLRRRDVVVALDEKRKFGIRWMWMKPRHSGRWNAESNGQMMGGIF